jgi:hypothetical protein
VTTADVSRLYGVSVVHSNTIRRELLHVSAMQQPDVKGLTGWKANLSDERIGKTVLFYTKIKALAS